MSDMRGKRWKHGVAAMMGCAAWFLIVACDRRDAIGPVQGSDILFRVRSGEEIHVRKAGDGPRPVVLLAGNSWSGRSFEPLLTLVDRTDDMRDRFTFYALDYRGSGGSTYRQPVSQLEDFARDFADLVRSDSLLQKGRIVLVGHSMGFGVAQLMVDLNPELYESVISLAGIGTRGVRVLFSGSTVGHDETTGRTYMPGDWADSLAAVAFHQRGWSGDLRTTERVAWMLNMVVFNDVLGVDPRTGTVAHPSFLDEPGYAAAIEDVLSTRYMPESLYACHRFNLSAATVTHTNHDGTDVVIPGEDRLTGFDGKPVLLVKATTDRASWRGDLVIDDSITQNTKHDLRQAGAIVSTVVLPAAVGFDHGLPISHPGLVLGLIVAFAETGEVTAASLDGLFGGGGYTLYPHDHVGWAEGVYGGF